MWFLTFVVTFDDKSAEWMTPNCALAVDVVAAESCVGFTTFSPFQYVQFLLQCLWGYMALNWSLTTKRTTRSSTFWCYCNNPENQVIHPKNTGNGQHAGSMYKSNIIVSTTAVLPPLGDMAIVYTCCCTCTNFKFSRPSHITLGYYPTYIEYWCKLLSRIYANPHCLKSHILRTGCTQVCKCL